MSEAQQADYGETPSVSVSYGQGPTNHGMYFSELPQNHTCQFCGHTGGTDVHNQVGLLTLLLAGGICFVGCWYGCCLIPFCIPQCKDQVHCCASCHKVVGKHSIFQ
eukprot:TRINITY_DN710_c0_g1_i2.p1 TRINITY_DN710_c0_g1~~TRINITY_DN710_c0_g1_i2.p1  ORF type:complete len:121 (-),score=2.72 TRINITY_DN710_c0_g1_i2:62-379(-)